MSGELHILATITKNTVNGLVYLSGSVDNCYIVKAIGDSLSAEQHLARLTRKIAIGDSRSA
ncbi:MAG: hypothetical protein U0M20_07120 [Christensenellales bacterium]|nr:hypothetical protein [Christensenellales bacterium]